MRAGIVILGALLTAVAPGCGRSPASRTAGATAAAPPRGGATTARAAVEAALKTAPDDPSLHVELALLERADGELPAAVKRLTEAWRRFPRHPRAPFHLGLLHLANGNAVAAVAPLEAAAAAAPGDAELQYHAALALFRAGMEPQAREYAARAHRLDPDHPQTWLLLARLNDHHGTALKAIAYAKGYLARSPEPAPGLYLIGRIYARLGSKEEAAEWLNRAAETDPHNVETLVTLGRVYYEMFKGERTKDGIALFQRALQLQPDHWEAHRFLARAAMDERRFQDAVDHFEAALKTAPRPYDFTYDYGQALLRAGRSEEGGRVLARYEAYRKARERFDRETARLSKRIQARPRDRGPRYELARFCLSMGQVAAAENVLRETAQALGTDTTLENLMKAVQAARAAGPAGVLGGGHGRS